MHTMDGVSAVTRLVMTATAKHRKKMVKGLKGLVAKVANDDYGRMVRESALPVSHAEHYGRLPCVNFVSDGPVVWVEGPGVR